MAQTHLNLQILVGLHFDYSDIVHICAVDILHLLMYFLNLPYYAKVQVFLLVKESQHTCLTIQIVFSVQIVLHVQLKM